MIKGTNMEDISMKTVLITGGTDGIGKGLVLHYLQEGCRVFAISSSTEKGKTLVAEANNLGKGNLTFIQANLSLVEENLRVVKSISQQTEVLDVLVLCAASLKPQPSYIKTPEGFEFTFALYYLSRYILCHQLKGLLEKAGDHTILNVAAPGMTGKVNWDDIQMMHNYNGQNAQFHGSRLNDLLGASFCNSNKIKFILFNPMAARTNGATKMGAGNAFMKFTMKLYYKLLGKEVNEIVAIINKVVANTKTFGLSAYKLNKPVDVNMETFDKANAKKLHLETAALLQKCMD